jgi:N,N'-diacetyllegionaminate synthase
MATRALTVRSRPAIGPGLPPYVIAEIGTNHNQRLATARAMLDALARTGCDCAKFQIYEPDEIVSARVRAADYGFDGLYGDISAQEMFERHLKTPKTWFPELRDLCHSLGMDFAATIHGANGLEWARANGLDIVKIASMDHSNLPFLRSLVNDVDAPILVSLGMASQSDADAVVAATRAHDRGVGLFHCCSIYPPGPGELRLANIPFLLRQYPLPVGFSDHTVGTEDALTARRLGAMMFEKHVTLDRTQPGPDHSFATEMGPFKAYVEALKRQPVEDAAAGAFVEMSERERVNRLVALKSIISRRPLEAGHVLTPDDVYLARPGSGIAPASLPQVLGRRLARTVSGETPLQWEDVEDRA